MACLHSSLMPGKWLPRPTSPCPVPWPARPLCPAPMLLANRAEYHDAVECTFSSSTSTTKPAMASCVLDPPSLQLPQYRQDTSWMLSSGMTMVTMSNECTSCPDFGRTHSRTSTPTIDAYFSFSTLETAPKEPSKPSLPTSRKVSPAPKHPSISFNTTSPTMKSSDFPLACDHQSQLLPSHWPSCWGNGMLVFSICLLQNCLVRT
mmetsp:Transcript_83676/g.224274  ORF Transcript_83676/g.224274 Transcript_83676/m.224274 type:complete len:205 (-) Transcript_83676:158-772(-)